MASANRSALTCRIARIASPHTYSLARMPLTTVAIVNLGRAVRIEDGLNADFLLVLASRLAADLCVQIDSSVLAGWATRAWTDLRP